jgi:cell division transport system permease protein
MYVLKAAASSIARNRLMAFVSLGVMVVSIFVFGVFLLITGNAQRLVAELKQKVEIRAFLSDALDADDVMDAQKRIEELEGVQSVTYVSKEEAYARFKDDLRDKPDLLEAIETNPFPASFEITLLPGFRTAKEASMIASKIESSEAVEEAEYGKEWVARLDEIVSILVVVDVTVGVIIAISCLFLVFNTIRLTVFARREEIEIMSLVGATDGFIRRPFLLVGVFYGLVGGGFASGLLYLIYRAVALKIPAINFLEPSYVGGLILFAALLGYSGSVFSVRRFLTA